MLLSAVTYDQDGVTDLCAARQPINDARVIVTEQEAVRIDRHADGSVLKSGFQLASIFRLDLEVLAG